MTKIQAIVLGKFLAGEKDVPEILKVRITKNTPKNVAMAIIMLRGAPDIQDIVLRSMVISLFSMKG